MIHNGSIFYCMRQVMDLTPDRRGSKRYKYQTNMWHTNILPKVLYRAKLYNLSKTGVYFETDQTLYVREKIHIVRNSAVSTGDKKDLNRIEIKWGNQNTKGFDIIEIKWRKELKNSSFLFGYGAVFMNFNTNFRKIIDAAALDKYRNSNRDLEYIKDPRELAREIYRKVITIRSKNQTYKGVVLNINRAGAFIATKKRLHLGQIIHLEIPGDSLFRDLKLKGVVVRKDPNGVGVKFDKRTGLDRRNDIDRRRGPDRRVRRKHKTITK